MQGLKITFKLNMTMERDKESRMLDANGDTKEKTWILPKLPLLP